jgi:hypothetical protein
MNTKFKTIVTGNGEYGVLEVTMMDTIYTSTSTTPTIFSHGITFDELKEYFTRWKVNNTDDNFNWETHVPEDWKFVDIEISIK